jgi:hypothetical protein
MEIPMARKSKLFVNLVAGLALLFVAAFARADEAKHAPNDQEDLSRLAAIWQGNLSEIKSAHVRYRSLARIPSKIVSNRDAVLKLLKRTDFINRPDDARMLSKELGLDIPPEHATWGNGELFATGTKIRVNSDYEGRRHSEMVLIDEAQISANRPNNQIDIYVRNGSRSHVKSLDELRIIPRLEKQAAATIENRSADGLVVKIGAKQFLVEEGTGFVQSVRTESVRSSDEIFQKGRVAFPGGIIFPAAVITCLYSRGDLKFIQIDVIETATFNEPIKDEVFAVSAPTGSKVFDRRKNEDEPGYFTHIEEPVADILTEIDSK